MYGYMPGLEQPDMVVSFPKERRIAGYAIGILKMDVLPSFLPGELANATTLDFPVLHKIVEGVTSERYFVADPTIADDLIRAGKELEVQGVRAITSSCGLLAAFQKKVAAALDVPVFLSSLLQIPIISRALKPDQKIGVLTASAPTLSPSHLSDCGVDDMSNLVIAGTQDWPKDKGISVSKNPNPHTIEREMVSLARQLCEDNPDIGAIVLEASSFPTQAWAIQNATHRPVFDLITLVKWIFNGVVRRPFAGFI